MWGQIAGAVIGGIGSAIGASQARGAIKRAGTIEQEAAEYEAQNALARILETNPQLAEAYQRAQQGVSGVGNTAADTVVGAGREANELLDPYTGVGTQAATSLAEFAGPGKAFSESDLELDPGYQFRLTEGQKALERSAAARGTLQGGGTLKALTRYAQGAASQEYAAAFDRFEKSKQNRFSNLSTLASLGYNAAGRAGTNLIGTAETAGGIRTRASELEANYGVQSATSQVSNLLSQDAIAREMRLRAANARSGSTIGAGQATADLWGGLGKTAGGALSLWDLTRAGRPGGGGYGPAGAPASGGGWGGYG